MIDKLQITEKSKIYVLCPSNLKTGGTELLHQLVASLLSFNKNAYIAYYLEGKYDSDRPTPEAFEKYIGDQWCRVNEIEDAPDNVAIFPETSLGKSKKLHKLQKCAWWLSVDNYIVMKGMHNRLKQYGIMSYLKHLVLNDYFNDDIIATIPVHLFQSFYAADFVRSKGVSDDSLFYLSDYINDIYMMDFDHRDRKNIVAYNPKKGIEYTKKIISSAPDISWVPIVNMTDDEVKNLLGTAKVYIDFGNHPGKDRIPREAAMSGCCVITDLKGSAAYEQDVPIPSKYKFKDVDRNIPAVISQIEYCFDEYETATREFDRYRMVIKDEKREFDKCVKYIFL